MDKIKAVLFDLDGTLIDSEYFYFKNWAPILKDEFNLVISYEDWIRDFAGHTLAHNVGLGTSRFRSTVDTVLGKHGLLDYFEFFVTRECVEFPKPNPEPYRLALTNLNLAADSCVAIEDTITGSKSALGAGMRLIAVTKQEVERARLTAVDNIVENLSEAKALLSQWI